MPDRPDTATTTAADGTVLHLTGLTPWEEREPDLAFTADGSPALAGLRRAWGLTGHTAQALHPAALPAGPTTVTLADGTTCRALVRVGAVTDAGLYVVELQGVGPAPWR